MTVNVSREHRGELTRNVRRANDIARRRKGEVGGADGRAFDTVMEAQQTRRSSLVAPSRLLESIAEARANIATLIRKTRECDGRIAHFRDKCARSIEHMNSRMRQNARVRQTRALVVPGYDEYRHATIGNSAQRLVRLIGDRRENLRRIEHISRVHDEIDLAGERWRERSVIVRDEVVAATSPGDARLRREVEAEVGVSQQEYPDVARHPDTVRLPVFVR